MNDWLHVYCSGWKGVKHKKVREWGYRRGLSDRSLLKSVNRDWIIMNARHFAMKNALLFFVHDETGCVSHHEDYRNTAMPDVSKEFKTFYNTTMTDKLKVEIPNLAESKNIKDIGVRARFKSKEEPESLTVIAELHDGRKVRFNGEARYGFPTTELVAKIGLLL